MRVGDEVDFGGEGNAYLTITTVIGWFAISIAQTIGILFGDKSPVQVLLGIFPQSEQHTQTG